MARITTNTTGTQPVIILSTQVAGNLTIPFIQDLTITNSTGVYSYTTFTDADQRKLSTPANNEISTNIVIDSDAFFGNVSTGSAGSADYMGLALLSESKTPITFTVYWAGDTGAGSRVTTGTGFITSLASKTSPTAPVWVTPLNIAVDGALTTTKMS